MIVFFDLLDTMGGQNLSLQVHPLTEYIYEKFGMPYTQDESYYLLDADEDEETYVYLGLKEGVDKKEMGRELRAAEKGEELFPAEKYVNKIPVKKHDHVLIPAGTVHCSGKNTMVLEISATPYIFTFKLWDWGRPSYPAGQNGSGILRRTGRGLFRPWRMGRSVDEGKLWSGCNEGKFRVEL